MQVLAVMRRALSQIRVYMHAKRVSSLSFLGSWTDEGKQYMIYNHIIPRHAGLRSRYTFPGGWHRRFRYLTLHLSAVLHAETCRHGNGLKTAPHSVLFNGATRSLIDFIHTIRSYIVNGRGDSAAYLGDKFGSRSRRRR